MADTAYWTHASAMGRLTRGRLRDFAAKAVLGKTAAELAAGDSTILNELIQEKVLSWKAELPGVRGYSERKATVTFDPASVDTRVELPADFDDLHPSMGGRITRLDSDGNLDEKIEVITIGGHRQEQVEGYNRYDDRDDEVAYLFGTSTNGRRFLEIKPAPTVSTDYEVVYCGLPEILDADGDELEAPLQLHEGIRWDTAAVFAHFKGNEKADRFQALADRLLERMRDIPRVETNRPGRVVHFSEVGGYAAFNRAE